MRLAAIASQLKRTLPQLTSILSDNLQISSITVTGNLATVNTVTDHDLVTGQVVTMVGMETRTPIDAVSKTGLNFDFVTDTDHDLTEGWPEHATIRLIGFTNPAWNTEHALVRVDSRNKFTIQSNLSLPTLNGNEILLETNRVDGLNGAVQVSVVTKKRFTFVVAGVLAGTYTPVNGRVVGSPRVSVAVNVERLQAIYSSRSVGKFYLFVLPRDSDVSRDRTTESDAVSAKTSGADMRLRMISRFTLIIVGPANDQISAETTLDVCGDTLLLPIMRALFGFRLPLPDGMDGISDFRTVPISHGVEFYDRACLGYFYDFEAPFDLSEAEANFDPSLTRAFRDVEGLIEHDGDDRPLEVTVNLDVDP
jgi:hypothetical protein